MKSFKIPVTWECYGVIEAEGNNLEEAIQNALKFEREVGYGLPEGDYVDASFDIKTDVEYVEIFNLD